MLQVSVPIAYELLAQCIKQGQALVQRASLVGDFSDYESWKAARSQWIDPTVQALEHMYGGPAEAREFADGATCPDGGKRWQEQYGGDLKCVKQAIDFLGVLQGDLAFENGSGPPALAELAPVGAALTVADEQTAAEADPSHDSGAGLARDAIDPQDESAASRGSFEERTSAPEQQPPAAASDEPQSTRLRDAEGDPDPDPYPGREQSEPAHEHDAAAEQAAAVERAPDRALEHAAQEAQRIDTPAVDDGLTDERRTVGAELAHAQQVGSELAQHAQPSPPAEREQHGAPAMARTRDVYLAHGRDEKWKQAVEHLLEQAGEHEIKIVNQRSKERARLTDELREDARGSHYAVVLLTADDVGGARLESSTEPYFSTRAHQGVVFEMGFLVAALTPGRVCVLYEDGVELPCDLDGVSHVRLDLAGTWQPKLLLHLRRAGFDYDMNKLVSV
jgi:predicted nucleotide-binding protein